MVNSMKIKNIVFLSILTSIVSCSAEVNRNGAYDWGSSQSILFYELVDKPRIAAAATRAANTVDFSSSTIPTGWTGTWTISSNSSSCPSAPCLASSTTTQTSAISVTRTVNAGSMTFLWRKDGASDDICSFTVDGINPGSGSSLASSFTLTSTNFTITSAGSKVFRWNYAKSSSFSSTQCFIDTIVFP